MTSDVNVPIEYSLTISKWDSSGIQFKLNFSEPLLISQGDQPDEVEIVIRDPYMFVGWKSREIVSVGKMKITIPRQMPDGESFTSADRRSTGYSRFL